jgi:hypothetical protein
MKIHCFNEVLCSNSHPPTQVTTPAPPGLTGQLQVDKIFDPKIKCFASDLVVVLLVCCEIWCSTKDSHVFCLKDFPHSKLTLTQTVTPPPQGLKNQLQLVRILLFLLAQRPTSNHVAPDLFCLWPVEAETAEKFQNVCASK